MGTAADIEVRGFVAHLSDPDKWTLTFPESYGIEDLDAFLAEFEGFIEARPTTDFRLLIDVRQVARSSSATRRRIAAFFNSQGPHFETRCRAFALVVSSALQRGAITTIFWLRPVGWNTKVFTSAQDAAVWLEQG